MYYLFLLKTFQQPKSNNERLNILFYLLFYPTLLFSFISSTLKSQKAKRKLSQNCFVSFVSESTSERFIFFPHFLLFFYIQYRKKIPLCLPPFFTTEFSLSLISLPIFIIAYRMEQKNSLTIHLLMCQNIFFLYGYIFSTASRVLYVYDYM